jgi:hypothetical protein
MQQLSTKPDIDEPAISPARAALSKAIEALGVANDQLVRASEPLATLERVAAQSAEAVELHNKLLRLRAADAEVFGIGSEPASETGLMAPEFSEAEKRVARLADCAAEADRRIPGARRDYVAAVDRLRHATTERDDALWRAAAEAATPEFRRLENAIQRVLAIEARLLSLVLALQETGNREPEARGALSAAEKIQMTLGEIRRKPEYRVDLEIGRSLISRLRSDPYAVY